MKRQGEFGIYLSVRHCLKEICKTQSFYKTNFYNTLGRQAMVNSLYRKDILILKAKSWEEGKFA